MLGARMSPSGPQVCQGCEEATAEQYLGWDPQLGVGGQGCNRTRLAGDAMK